MINSLSSVEIVERLGEQAVKTKTNKQINKFLFIQYVNVVQTRPYYYIYHLSYSNTFSWLYGYYYYKNKKKKMKASILIIGSILFLALLAYFVYDQEVNAKVAVKEHLQQKGYTHVSLERKFWTVGCGGFWKTRKGDVTFKFTAYKNGMQHTGKVTRRYQCFANKVVLICEDD